MNTKLADLASFATKCEKPQRSRVINSREFKTNLWDAILDRYKTVYNEGELFRILKQIILVELCDCKAYLYSPERLTEQEQKQVIRGVLKVCEDLELPIELSAVQMLSTGEYRIIVTRSRAMLSPTPRLKAKAKLSPSDITEMAALAMDVKEAEILGLLPSRVPCRSIVTYCFVSFGYGDQESFLEHMRYVGTEQMWLDVLTIEAALDEDPEISGLVDLVLAEIAELLKAKFSNDADVEDENRIIPAGENILQFPNAKLGSGPFSALLRDF